MTGKHPNTHEAKRLWEIHEFLHESWGTKGDLSPREAAAIAAYTLLLARFQASRAALHPYEYEERYGVESHRGFCFKIVGSHQCVSVGLSKGPNDAACLWAEIPREGKQPSILAEFQVIIHPHTGKAMFQLHESGEFMSEAEAIELLDREIRGRAIIPEGKRPRD